MAKPKLVWRVNLGRDVYLVTGTLQVAARKAIREAKLNEIANPEIRSVECLGELTGE